MIVVKARAKPRSAVWPPWGSGLVEEPGFHPRTLASPSLPASSSLAPVNLLSAS